MNDEQCAAFDQILASVDGQLGHVFFLSGPGGTGKTFVYLTLCYTLCARTVGPGQGPERIVLCVSSSGISALLLPLGRTAHSTFKIPIPIFQGDACKIAKGLDLAKIFPIVAAIIWDESAMQHRCCMEAVNLSAKDILGRNVPFGGITVVFGGDFQQIPPVIERGSRADIVNASLRNSALWQELRVLKLTQNMRVDPEELEFAQWLLNVGHGRANSSENTLRVPEHMLVGSTIQDLITAVYPALDLPQPRAYFSDRTILSPLNLGVDELNAAMLEQFSAATPAMDLFSADSAHNKADGDDAALYTTEFLNSLNPSSLPAHKLSLKVGCPVMVLRNIDPPNGLCNGTRGIVCSLSPQVIQIEIMGGEHDGTRHFIPRSRLIPSETKFPFIFHRRQFPVRLAFAMTINKAQGQSVWFVGLDLRQPVFCHGQLYVGLSRCTSSRRVKVLLPDGANKCTTNIVWPELLLP